MHTFVFMFVCAYVYIVCGRARIVSFTISSLLQGISSLLQGSFEKETYNLKEPTDVVCGKAR